MTTKKTIAEPECGQIKLDGHSECQVVQRDVVEVDCRVEAVGETLSTPPKNPLGKHIYRILRGRIKGFNHSITTILFEVGSYRTVVG